MDDTIRPPTRLRASPSTKLRTGFLQRAFDQEDRCGVDHGTVALKHIGDHHGVRRAGFVLERNEAEPLGGSRPLSHDYQTGDLRPLAIACASEIGRAQHALARQRPTQMRHDVRTHGDAGAFVVGESTLECRHARQGAGCYGVRC